ncbi:MAG: histidine kinase [Proteobacteria bacterium]|nr:histidine kinase [Pseudomonadota bacterium]
MNFSLEPLQYIIFLILIKLALITIVAAMLANFDYFAHKLFSDNKTLKDRYILSSIFCGTLLIGVILRHNASYHALDYSITGFFITGIAIGFLPALLSVAVLSLFFIFYSGEYFMALLCFISATAGAMLYKPELFYNKRRVYNLTLWMIPVTAIAAVIYRYAPQSWVFTLSNRTLEGDVVVALSDVIGVFLTLFLWRYYRTKLELIESAYNLDKSRLAILSAKINPHFLFNTLNTIAASIRINPNIAREIVFKLSEILRYVLSAENEYKPLQDEINFIENYLAIETLRFGETRLKVSIDVDENAKELNIPTMLIQPIVENAIKHGIAPLADRRGELTIGVRSLNDSGVEMLVIKVMDNGPGMVVNDRVLFGRGIGLVNVRDRLKLLYGDKAKLDFDSNLNKGTTATITVPAER